MQVIKGHATGNDFVLIDDRDGALELTAAFTRALCDRHAGVGADGVLRLVRTATEPDVASMAATAEYFMDYRNADGSIAEMCGNGARLFMRYLQSVGLVGARTAIATRGGVREVWLEDDDLITVAMGAATVVDGDQSVRVPRRSGGEFAASAVALRVPNPHTVVAVATEAVLADLDLGRPPTVRPGLAEGQNVEFVVTVGPQHLMMRVHERGVGETESCGTGICAAVVAAGGPGARGGVPWLVDVPGGRCQVRWAADGELLLSGPAQLVGTVELTDSWLIAAGVPIAVARQ